MADHGLNSVDHPGSSHQPLGNASPRSRNERLRALASQIQEVDQASDIYTQVYGPDWRSSVPVMATISPPAMPTPDRFVVIHVATTCDEHGVYVTKDSAEVIEIGWILVDAKTFEEVRHVYMLLHFGERLTGVAELAIPRCHTRQACQHADNSSVQ